MYGHALRLTYLLTYPPTYLLTKSGWASSPPTRLHLLYLPWLYLLRLYSLQRLGLQPARLAATWIAFAFAGYLPPEQTLLLWDRVIGFDSLEPLPMLAAAIFLFHERALLQAYRHIGIHHCIHHAYTMHIPCICHAYTMHIPCAYHAYAYTSSSSSTSAH